MQDHHCRGLGALARTAAIISILGAPLAASAADEYRSICINNMVRGTYTGQIQGTQTMPDGTVQNIIGVVVRFYDGSGNVTQHDSVKNSTTGYAADRYGSGIYRVNQDCTYDVEFHPAPNINILERGVIMDEGYELRSITVVPTGLFVTSTAKRVRNVRE